VNNKLSMKILLLELSVNSFYIFVSYPVIIYQFYIKYIKCYNKKCVYIIFYVLLFDSG